MNEAQGPARAEGVMPRFFAGLSVLGVAQALALSLATVERYWAYARLWLYADLTEAGRQE